MSDAKFTTGSTMRHVTVMTSTAALGLMAIFIVDLIDIYFLGLLGEDEIAAAIGYAGTILFITTSINIGTSIATGALAAQAIGRDQPDEAKTVVINAIAFAALFSIACSAAIWFAIPDLLTLLGATGRTLNLATTYLQILIPSMTIMAIGMCGSSALRATGDAKGAMYVTLVGGGVNLVLDPLFIFGFDWGVAGAAWASVAARIAICGVAIWGASYKHSLIGRFNPSAFFNDLTKILKIAIPSMLANVATPLGNAYVIATVASFGDSAVAGMSIIGRLTPVAFGLVFALSGAIGPIIGQNYGAKKYDRVQQALFDGIKFSTAVVITTSLILFFLRNEIVDLFAAKDEAATMIKLFCTWVAPSFVFTSMIFVSNAAFNNLGYPLYSTISNFCKAIVLTIPCVYLGALWWGYEGVLIGQAVASIIMGILTYGFCIRLVKNIDDRPDTEREKPHHDFHLRVPRWVMSNTRG